MAKQIAFFVFSTVFFICQSCKDNIERNIKQSENKALDSLQKMNIARTTFNKYICDGGDDLSETNPDKNPQLFIQKYFDKVKSKRKPISLYSLYENYIDSVDFDNTKEWLRIFINPYQGKNICFIIEKKLGRTFVTLKLGNPLSNLRCMEYNLTIVKDESFFDITYKEIHRVLSVNDDTYKNTTENHLDSWNIESIYDKHYDYIIMTTSKYDKDLSRVKLKEYVNKLIAVFLSEINAVEY